MMDEFNKVFEHFPQYKVIICKTCKYAPIPTHVKGHLQKLHEDIPKEVRHRIVDVVDDLADIARSPDEVQYPDPQSAPLPCLPVFRNAHVCQWRGRSGQACMYVCRGAKQWPIQRHCREKHQWRNWQEQGGRADERQQQTPNRVWISGQSCQRFFKIVEWQRYFRVQEEPSGGSQCASDGRGGHAEAIFVQYQTTIKEANAKRAIEDDANRLVPNAWLKFTGWADHLSKFEDKEQIKAYIQPAGDGDDCAEGDIGLEDACRGTRRLIRAALQTCKADIVGKAALESANQRETGADSNERPFYAGHQKKTVRKYSDVFVSKLRYLWRTAQQETKPKYFMTKRQSQCLERLRDVAAPEKFCSYTEGTRIESITARKAKRRQAIEDARMLFWIAMFDHELKDSEFKSGIISGLAVLGIDTQNGSWKTALNYTPILSAIVTVMRALVVYRAWQIRQQSIHNGIAAGLTQEEAEDEARSVVEGVDKLVERFMTLRKFGGRISPMDRILHMRTYGMKIRMTTKAGGTVSWEGSSILVNKIKFSMDDIRTVVHGLYETVRKRLNELLFVDREDAMPALDLKSLCDNPAELSEGWNFLKDRRNQFSVDGERWMWRRMFAEDVIEKYFIKGGLDHVRDRDDIQWNQTNVEDYFRKVRRFKEELLALVVGEEVCAMVSGFGAGDGRTGGADCVERGGVHKIVILVQCEVVGGISKACIAGWEWCQCAIQRTASAAVRQHRWKRWGWDMQRVLEGWATHSWN